MLHAGVMSPPLTWHRKILLNLITTEWCMLSKQCRNYARNDNVQLTLKGIKSLKDSINNILEPALALAAKIEQKRDSLYE